MSHAADSEEKKLSGLSKKYSKSFEFCKHNQQNFTIENVNTLSNQKEKYINDVILNKVSNASSISYISDGKNDKYNDEVNKIIFDLNNRPEIKKELIHIKEYYSKGASSKCFICESKKFPEKQFILKSIENKSNLMRCLNTANFNNQIKNEFCIQKKCRSRYVTSVSGIFQIEEKFLIFSEFEINGDLNNFKKNYLKMDKLSESMVIYFCGMILKGIEHLHKLKICHFDIKLENILINGFFNAKISDFSISMDYSNFTEYKLNSSGTQHYITPEQLENKKIKTTLMDRIDLWALGVVMYKLLYGNFPYCSKDKKLNNQQMLQEINETKLEFEQETSEDLKTFIARLLEKDIEKRIDLIEALNSPIMKTYDFLLEMKKGFSDFGKFIDVLKKESF